jgi:hypothetical protein
MAQQNINQYVYSKLRLNIINECQDMSLASDEVDFNQEVVFSPYLIAETYGNRLPINIDINNPLTVQNLNLYYKQYNYNNIFVSQNYYNPDNKDLDCFTASTACDIGLTGIDNGLVTSMNGEIITYTNGLFNDQFKFDRLYFDRRFKMFQVTGYTSQNERFSGIPDTTLYEVVSKTSSVGKYHELYGGFYQGFYKLFGYDYEIFPERMNKGWSVEMLLKPRFFDEYTPLPGETNLNLTYPNNEGIFFYFGARAENKFYHHADGTPNCFPSYTRVTNGLEECVQTCACCNTGITNSRCIYVYPPRSKNNQHDPHLNYGCTLCGGLKEKQLTCGCDCGDYPCEICGWECFDHSCPVQVSNTVQSLNTIPEVQLFSVPQNNNTEQNEEIVLLSEPAEGYTEWVLSNGSSQFEFTCNQELPLLTAYTPTLSDLPIGQTLFDSPSLTNYAFGTNGGWYKILSRDGVPFLPETSVFIGAYSLTTGNYCQVIYNQKCGEEFPCKCFSYTKTENVPYYSMYVDCDGNIKFPVVPFGETINICGAFSVPYTFISVSGGEDDCVDNQCETPPPTPTVSPQPPSPTPDCLIPTPICTPTCTTCDSCEECVDCPATGFTSIQTTCESDPLFDSMSNALALRICGPKENPKIGVKVLRWTGECETTGTCVTGQTYVTGYTIDEYCSPNGIYDYCVDVNSAYLNQEHWFQVNVVWERYTWLDICDLKWRGGLADITKFEYLDSLANDTTKLISPPITHGTSTAETIELVNLDQSWLDDTKLRMGRLKIYVNGKIFFKIENFEEIIPRALSTDKEKQLGVPFNISWGGGTQGLRENLTFSACTALDGKYIQDPECFSTDLLNTTSLAGLKTNILLEENFAGTFDGGISQFRMYVEPLSAPEVKHNFLILKDTFNMLNPDCPDCNTIVCGLNDFTYTLVDFEYLVTQNYLIIATQSGNNFII